MSRLNKYLLVVSDDPSICRLFSSALHKPTHCDSVPTSGEAIQRLDNRQYSVLVLDLSSPNSSAHEVLAHVQRLPREKRPLTFVLVEDANSLPTQLDPKVVTMVIAKPFETSDIAAVVRQTLISLMAVATDETLRELDRPYAEPIEAEPIEPSCSGVLVVDDDRTVNNLIVAALQREGLTPESAMDGAQAVEALLKKRFCAIVLDLMMPKMSGWDVIDWLKANPELQPRSVIVSTAADRSVLHELDPSIVNAIFVKPFNALELAGYVRTCAMLSSRDRRRKRVIGAEPEIQR